MTQRHLARRVNYETLINGLHEEIDKGNVNRVVCHETNLSLFTYSKQCVYSRSWNAFTVLARGLIVDTKEKRIVATPFPKFFNLYERDEKIPDLPFEVFEKMDGSLIILFFYDGKWRTATKGSFTSDQARWAQDWVGRHDTGRLFEGVTYLCEAIYKANKIVVPYETEGLFLLGAYDEYGNELSNEWLQIHAHLLGWPVAKIFQYNSIADLVNTAATLPKTEEGFVIRFQNGYRLKIKGEEYLRLHRAISRLTPLTIWELFKGSEDITAFRRDLPEEFWNDFDTILGILYVQHNKILKEVHDLSEECWFLSDKELGLKLKELGEFGKLVFLIRNKKLKKLRDVICMKIRPTGNRLEGYTPSCLINQTQEE